MIEAVLPVLLPALIFAGLAVWRWRGIRLPAVRAEVVRVTARFPHAG